MLNTSKIDSLINYAGSNASKVAKGTGIPYTSIKTKIERKSWSPNDIEKIADYFKKPINYFFDREDEPNISEDPQAEYRRKCLQCEEKDKRIIELQEKLLAIYENERGAELNGDVRDAVAS